MMILQALAMLSRLPVVSNTVRRLREQNGQGMVEYGLILALIAVVVIGVVSALGGQIGSLFQTICTTLNSGSACSTTTAS